MNVYCGTDIIEVNRIKEAIINNEKFIENIFTTNEQKYCEVNNAEQKYMHYAGRFAAKEAIYKAISKAITNIGWLDIEIINDTGNKGRPIAIVNNDLIKDIDVSISHVKEYAIAMAIVNFS